MVAPAWKAWRGRRVFITGHTGFKGSWLSLWLTQLGAVVCGYALNPPTDPNLFQMARVSERMLHHHGDISDAILLRDAMSTFAPEVVFHLAAQPLVRHSYIEPALTYATNVMGTVNVLEAIRQVPSVRAVVVVTTDKCYENRDWQRGYNEGDRLGGHDPYSSSKACAELVCAAYRHSFFASAQHSNVALATARAGNVIGGGDWAVDRLVPDLVRGFITGESVSIRNPHAIRPWQHVLEPLRGYLYLAEQLLTNGPRYASAWNFGPNEADAQSVAWIADRFAQLCGGGVWYPGSGPHAHEATRLQLDCTKAKQSLGWRPLLNIAEALQLTASWTQQWKAGADMQAVTLGQIAAYQQHCTHPHPVNDAIQALAETSTPHG